MNRRNLILEWIWECTEWIALLPIAAAVIIVAVNIHFLFFDSNTEYPQETDARAAQKEHPVRQDALYIEETRLSGTEIYLQEMSQDEPSGGYLVTAEMAMLAQLVQAEAGNQDLTGKRLVADVVLNRVDSDKFPGTIEEVIFQKNPVQFGVTVDGAFKRVGVDASEECFEAVRMEWDRETRLDREILYFNTVHENGIDPFKHGDHWFSY